MYFSLLRKSIFSGILFLSFALVHNESYAQNIDPNSISNEQALEFYKRAKASGLTDMAIEQAALEKGYTLDQISAMRNRLQQAQTSAPTGPDRSGTDESRRQIADSMLVKAKPVSALPNSDSVKQVFGASFFSSSSISFEPNLRIATPKNYILGPDDELVVDIYGNSVDNFRLKISPEGTVKMLNLAPVQVNGLTIEQASERIVNRLRSAYSALNRPGGGTYSTITLGNVRSIQVMITGEVTRPGSYTISSLATAFNALNQSGGPNNNGSYRSIEIIRNNKTIRTIDLYGFLVDANLKDNITMQDQDIILVRPYSKRIELFGEVKHPALFEVKDGETLKDMIRYAGGYTPTAYSASIQFRRNTGKELMVGSVQETEVANFIPQNGDVFKIGKILNRIENRVVIEGGVFRDGEYPIDEQTNTVKKLITKSEGLREDAFLNRAIIERKTATLRPEIISFDLGKLMNGEIEDIVLKREDHIYIKTIDELKENYDLTILGSVINPGTINYHDGITVADAIFKAGGYTEGGIPYRIEVSRRIKGDTANIPQSQNVRIFSLEVSENLTLNEEDQKFKLSPFDVIYVRKSPRYEPQKAVTILGEIMYPGTYTILNNFERITDLLPKAGGLKAEAYISGARFYRNKELVAVDLKAIIQKPSLSANLLLQTGDTLLIPTKSETVRIKGGVQNPSIVNFDPHFSFREYISQAGGFAEYAWKSRIYVSYPNGRTFRTKKFLFFKSYPKIESGSVLTVPVKDPQKERQISPSERIAIISLVTTISLALISLFR
ncbi:protein involved in polysaccharide export, contains SLBB domain of the beta-grasp fold [Dyadobacter koreensis]|uniref:Protein involved in polysaccharide export, contains SLBB domain of the beta-grasp fold n=1 Tax=Dyadobacter koreensis TaxID=408657 RepID=A0A1H6RKL7_9BACT|nr:SLBB domain-containing protein [Dyadobacter koreensis]SEI52135.1 protein involved in polysaccharide export, contains SLBB domain of the beta-grasp fold [Dyadobacter koreensis]